MANITQSAAAFLTNLERIESKKLGAITCRSCAGGGGQEPSAREDIVLTNKGMD